MLALNCWFGDRITQLKFRFCRSMLRKTLRRKRPNGKILRCCQPNKSAPNTPKPQYTP